MKIWRVKLVDCDGGRLGKVQQERFFLREMDANFVLSKEIENRNYAEERCGKPYRFVEDNVEGVEGYCNWQYGIMFILDSVEVYG